MYRCQHHFISFSDHRTEVGKQIEGRIVMVMGDAIKVDFIGDRASVEKLDCVLKVSVSDRKVC